MGREWIAAARTLSKRAGGQGVVAAMVGMLGMATATRGAAISNSRVGQWEWQLRWRGGQDPTGHWVAGHPHR